MQLPHALQLVSTPDRDGGDTYEAFRVIGRHLASGVELGPEAVALAVGRDALDLLAGACEVLGELRTFAVVGRPSSTWPHNVELSWITGPPPHDRPLLVVDHSISTGATMRAVLAYLRPADERTAVTVLVVEADPEGAASVLNEHSEVNLVAIDGRWPRSAAAEADMS